MQVRVHGRLDGFLEQALGALLPEPVGAVVGHGELLDRGEIRKVLGDQGELAAHDPGVELGHCAVGARRAKSWTRWRSSSRNFRVSASRRAASEAKRPN